MFAIHSSIRFGMCLLIVTLMTGCGSSNPLNRQAVSGTVSLGGEPIASGSIEFQPTGAGGTMSGAVITNGEYQIPLESGLPPGEYLVRISSADENAEPVEAPGESNKLAVEKIPAEFNSESNVNRTVEAGKANVFDFEIPAS